MTLVGRIPAECAPVLERLQCDAETWLDFVKNFRKRFRNEAGLAPLGSRFATCSEPVDNPHSPPHGTHP